MARRRLIGKVVSNKMTKTVTVEVELPMIPAGVECRS